MVEKIKLALRIKTDAFNNEIQQLIDACKIDMQMAGVSQFPDDDASFLHAATLYCKARFGFSEDSTRWQSCYENLRDTMALSKEYGVVQNPETKET